MKIYVAVVEALRKKERQDETQFTIKIGGKLVWDPVTDNYGLYIVFRAIQKHLRFSIFTIVPSLGASSPKAEEVLAGTRPF